MIITLLQNQLNRLRVSVKKRQLLHTEVRLFRITKAFLFHGLVLHPPIFKKRWWYFYKAICICQCISESPGMFRWNSIPSNVFWQVFTFYLITSKFLKRTQVHTSKENKQSARESQFLVRLTGFCLYQFVLKIAYRHQNDSANKNCPYMYDLVLFWLHSKLPYEYYFIYFSKSKWTSTI